MAIVLALLQIGVENEHDRLFEKKIVISSHELLYNGLQPSCSIIIPFPTYNQRVCPVA